MKYTVIKNRKKQVKSHYSYSAIEFFYDTTFTDYRPLLKFFSPGVKFREGDNTFRILPPIADINISYNNYLFYDRRVARRVQDTATQMLRRMQARFEELVPNQNITVIVDGDYLSKKYKCEVVND